MPLVRTLVFCCALLHGLSVTPTVEAQDSFGQNWQSLSPDTRKQKREQYFSTLPEPQQQQLRESQRKFHALPPDQKRDLCVRFMEQNGYAPPACASILDN